MKGNEKKGDWLMKVNGEWDEKRLIIKVPFGCNDFQQNSLRVMTANRESLSKVCELETIENDF